MSAMRASACLVVLVACVVPAASAQAGDPASTLVALKSLVDGAARMAPGTARVDRGCADVAKLRAAVDRLPKKLPAGASIDQTGWSSHVGTVQMIVRDLGKTCQAPDHKTKNAIGDVLTTDGQITTLHGYVEEMVNELRPRSLSAPMQKFNAALQKALRDKKHKNACRDTAAMKKAADGMGAAPAGVDGKKWDDKTVAINTFLGDMAQYCDGPDAQGDGNFEGLLGNVHDAFFELVMALPAK